MKLVNPMPLKNTAPTPGRGRSLSPSTRPLQTGATLIEVLVAILLVSVGLLGIAGLSGATYSYNKAAQVRLTGIALVNDFADRARINIYGYDRGAYAIALADDFTTTAVTVPASNLNLDPSVPANAITIADGLAAADVDQFLRAVRARLPQGDAVVTTRPGAVSRDMDVWLLWQEPQAAAADSLFAAGQGNCPSNLSAANQALYSCMYFKVGL